MGMAADGPHPLSDIAPRAPLVNLLRIHPCVQAIHIIGESRTEVNLLSFWDVTFYFLLLPEI